MKKLLIFTAHYLPYVGGLENHVAGIAERLSKKGYQVTIFTSNIPKTKELEVVNPNLRIIRYPAFHVIENYPVPKLWSKKYRSYIKQLKNEGYDIVMSRTRFFFSSFLAYLFARKTKTKYVHVEHGNSFVKLGSWWKDLIALTVDLTTGAWIIKHADLCLGISNGSRDFLSKFRKGNIPIINRGIDFDYLKRIKPSINNKKIKIGYSARIIFWKGLQNALEGFNMLPEKLKDNAIFYVGGGGPDEDWIKKKYESKNIKFFGKLTRDESVALMKSCDIFTHPTISGGALSTSLLEAMACDNALVGTPAEGGEEVLFKNNSILIKESDPKLFRDAFIKLIENKRLRVELSKKAKEFIHKKFTWDEKINDYDKLLTKLIDEPRRK